jgi:hypothetical protein
LIFFINYQGFWFFKFLFFLGFENRIYFEQILGIFWKNAQSKCDFQTLQPEKPKKPKKPETQTIHDNL